MSGTPVKNKPVLLKFQDYSAQRKDMGAVDTLVPATFIHLSEERLVRYETTEVFRY